jgi:glycosyl transferase family 25
MTFKLSVGALFKNEEHSLKEWIDHYLHHGADHFYLINDSSTDNSVSVIQNYIDKGIITLFETNNWNYYLGRQKDMYNTFILPKLSESDWLLMVDIDEYVWSPQSIDLKKVLDTMKHCSQIQISQTLFGSNGHKSQPKSIVGGFTKRAKDQATQENSKYFVNGNIKISSLNCHHASFVDGKDNDTFFRFDLPYFVMNHYCCQSLDFWKNVKCTRGDGDGYRQRTEEHFKDYDFNDVEDTVLLDQNKGILSIDRFFYINLDKRTDRRDEFLEEYRKMNLPDDKLERFTGILDDNHPSLGCCKSHLSILKLAKEREYKKIIIFEDDFEFILGSSEHFHKNLNEFLKRELDYRVLMLSYNIMETSMRVDDLIGISRNVQTASGYLVNLHYSEELISCLEFGVDMLEKTRQQYNYTNDQVWKKLQQDDKWYYLNDRVGRQRRSYSDIEKRVVEYGC